MGARTVPAALLGIALLMAGCLGTPSGPVSPGSTPTATGTSTVPTATPLPTGQVELPSGPYDRPERPPSLNRSAVREYVRTYEYRFAYNSLWRSERTDVNLECSVERVTERAWGYEVLVTCSGHSDTQPPETESPAVHADWFDQTFRYRVGENATHREYVSG